MPDERPEKWNVQKQKCYALIWKNLVLKEQTGRENKITLNIKPKKLTFKWKQNDVV